MKRKSFEGVSQRHYSPSKYHGIRRQPPRTVLLPAPSYYFLAAALTIAIFFISWWFLDTGGIGESPWIPAGVFASFFSILAVLLREIVLRKARARYLTGTRHLDNNVADFPISGVHRAGNSKLSVRQNTAILRNIEKKSAAANTLKLLPDVHLEVFELCEDYLVMTKRELDTIGIGSPRFGSIRKGNRRVNELHRYHLLTWAAIESQIYTKAASDCDIIAEKIEIAGRALDVLNAALEFYPEEAKLLESAEVVCEFVGSAKISNAIEKAEKVAFDGRHKDAIAFYKDALFYLAREDVKSTEKETLAQKINSEIGRLRETARNPAD